MVLNSSEIKSVDCVLVVKASGSALDIQSDLNKESEYSIAQLLQDEKKSTKNK